MFPLWFLRGACLLCAALLCGAGSSMGASAEFEVAAIHKSAPTAAGELNLSLLSDNYSRLKLKNYAVSRWVAFAYDVAEFQVEGPGWVSQEKYDLTAQMPSGSTKRDAPAMLQTLLAERFGLRTHTEARKASGFELVVGSNGAHLQRSLPSFGGPDAGLSGSTVSTTPTAIKFVYRNYTLSHLAKVLTGNTRVIVIDATNLAGTFDIPFEFSVRDLVPGIVSPDDGIGPSIIDALERLGLKLKRKTVTYDVVVVDEIHRPTEN